MIREAKKVIHDGEPRFLHLVGEGAITEKAEGVLEFPITCHRGGTLHIYIASCQAEFEKNPEAVISNP